MQSDAETVKQQADILYGLYERKSRSFYRAFAALASLATVVFGLVFWPYTNLRGEQFQLVASLAAEQTRLQEKQREFAEFAAERSWFRDAYREQSLAVTEFLDELHAPERAHRQALNEARELLQDEQEAAAWLAGSAERPNITPHVIGLYPRLQQLDIEDDCFWYEGQRWRRCHMSRSFVEFAELKRTYGYQRDSHLRNELREGIEPALNDLHGAFTTWLAGDSPGWQPERAADYELSEFVRFSERYLRAVRDHLDGLQSREAELDDAVEDQQRLAAALQQELDAVERGIGEIESLESIDTPLGEVPIGVNDLVMLFPMLLAVGFYLCAALFLDSAQLRTRFVAMSRERDEQMFSDEHVALIAPLWVDPLKTRGHRAARAAAFFAPAVIFLLAIGLLVHNRLLWGEFLDEVLLGAWAYYLMYLVGVVLFAAAGRRLYPIVSGAMAAQDE